MGQVSKVQIAKIRKAIVVEKVGPQYAVKLHHHLHTFIVGPGHDTFASANYYKDALAAMLINLYQSL